MGSDGMVGGDREHHECQTPRTVWVLYNYTATQCGHQITSKGILAEHKSAVHEGVKYPCRQCGYEATTKGSLAQHKRAVHEGVKFKCGQCGHQFT